MKRSEGTIPVRGVILLMIMALGLAACSSPSSASMPPRKTPAQPPTVQAFRFGAPVENQPQALIAAEAGLRGSFTYSAPLRVIAAEQMSWKDYATKYAAGSDRAVDLPIWLIIYSDAAFQSVPSGGQLTSTPPFRGCVSVVINAADGLPLEVGGPLDQGRFAGCD